MFWILLYDYEMKWIVVCNVFLLCHSINLQDNTIVFSLWKETTYLVFSRMIEQNGVSDCITKYYYYREAVTVYTYYLTILWFP